MYSLSEQERYTHIQVMQLSFGILQLVSVVKDVEPRQLINPRINSLSTMVAAEIALFVFRLRSRKLHIVDIFSHLFSL